MSTTKADRGRPSSKTGIDGLEIVCISASFDRVRGRLSAKGWLSGLSETLTFAAQTAGDSGAAVDFGIDPFDADDFQGPLEAMKLGWGCFAEAPALGDDAMLVIEAGDGATVRTFEFPIATTGAAADETGRPDAEAGSAIPLKVSCSLAAYDPARQALLAHGWAIGLDGAAISARTSNGRALDLKFGHRRPDVARGFPALGDFNIGWQLLDQGQDLADDEALIISVAGDSAAERSWKFAIKRLPIADAEIDRFTRRLDRKRPAGPKRTKAAPAKKPAKPAKPAAAKDPPIAAASARESSPFRIACSAAEYDPGSETLAARGWIVGLDDSMELKAVTTGGHEIRLQKALPRRDVAKKIPGLDHYDIGWKALEYCSSLSPDDQLLVTVVKDDQTLGDWAFPIVPPKSPIARSTGPLIVNMPDRKRVLFSDMGADARRVKLTEKLEGALHAADIELYGLFYFARRTSLPYFLVPRIAKPKNDSRFAFLKELPAELLSADVSAAATMQAAMSKYRVRDLAGRFWLFKLMIREQLDEIQPDLIVLWHQFNPYHTIVAEEAKRRSIPVIYGEHGVLPGSICFETGGQMAESWIARDPKAFKSLPLAKDDIERAKDYIEKIKSDRINRKAPGERLADHLPKFLRRRKRRPVLFYAGQNDPKAGLVPTDTPQAREHSPIFRNSFEALERLAELCKANGWDLLYKPHPQVGHYESIENRFDFAANPQVMQVPIEVDIIDCIEASDATVTIVSQSAYMALFNDKPCVLLGRMQLTGSGAVYDAKTAGSVEAQLKAAIGKGFTPYQQRMFVDHVARAARYYVSQFDDKLAHYFSHDMAWVATMIAGAIDETRDVTAVAATN